MRGINYVLLGGNIGRDPEVRQLPNGTKVATFDLAVNEKWKNDNGDMKERTDWFKIITYKDCAETCETYLSAGDSVVIVGRLATREWDGRESGQKRRVTEIVATKVSFVKIKKRGNSEDREPNIEGG